MEKSEAFKKTFQEYLLRIAELDLYGLAERTGSAILGDAICLPFLGNEYLVSPDGIADQEGREPHLGVSVVLCQYLLSFPQKPPKMRGWANYRDFPDAAPLAGNFKARVENALAGVFALKPGLLEKFCLGLGGKVSQGEYHYDAAMEVPVLPHLPMLVLFNEADEGFPASCLVLFDKSVEELLDMESLAICGYIFVELASKTAGAV